MFNSRKSLKTAGIIISVLIMAAVVLSIMVITGTQRVVIKVSMALDICALIFAFYYAYIGFKKDASQYYKGFMIVYAVSLLVSIVSMISSGTTQTVTYLTVAMGAIVCVAALVLGLAKNLGKERSIMLALLIIVVRALLLVRTLILYANVQQTLFINIVNLVLAIVASFFVFTKYSDKDMRKAD